MEKIADTAAVAALVEREPGVVLYFSSADCGVCKSLKPKVVELLQAQFPRLVLAEVACDRSPDVAAQYQAFTVPTLLVFFDGREFLRKTRNFALAELRHDLERPYRMLFG